MTFDFAMRGYLQCPRRVLLPQRQPLACGRLRGTVAAAVEGASYKQHNGRHQSKADDDKPSTSGRQQGDSRQSTQPANGYRRRQTREATEAEAEDSEYFRSTRARTGRPATSREGSGRGRGHGGGQQASRSHRGAYSSSNGREEGQNHRSTNRVEADGMTKNAGGNSSAGSDGGSRTGGGGQAPHSTNGIGRSSTSEIPLVRETQQGATGNFFSGESFKGVGASEEIVDALKRAGVARPSHVQAAAYKALRSGSGHVVLADHAGSGKTLAYLAPLIQELRAQEAAAGARTTLPNCPKVLVLAPTTELAAQVLRVTRAVGRGAPFRSVALTGGHKWRTQKDSLAEGVDLVVATPGRLLEHMKEGNVKLDACAAIVFDEVDVLLGDASGYADQVQQLREAAPASARFVFVTATLPEPVWMRLQADFPGISPALGPGLHCSAPGVVEQLVDCSGGDEISEETGFARKAEALLRLLRQQAVPRTIVFCNKIESCRRVENLLRRQADADYAVLPYHAAIEDTTRQQNLKGFLGAPVDGSQRLVLVSTDRASRGIDSAHVEHVVLFDFPRDPSEYVRRVGRTARGAGGQGTVSILVLGRQVPLAIDIIERNQKGLPIHRVPEAMVPSLYVPGTSQPVLPAYAKRPEEEG